MSSNIEYTDIQIEYLAHELGSACERRQTTVNLDPSKSPFLFGKDGSYADESILIICNDNLLMMLRVQPSMYHD